MNIYEKLERIQQELKAPKGQYNDFGKYKYRSCEDIFEAVKPILVNYDLVLKTSDELVAINERYYVKATAMLIDATNGDLIKNVSYAREEETKKGMDGSQITGASSSYARKYALNGLFLIDDTRDSDSTNVGEETEEQKKENALKYVFGEKTKHPGKTILEVYEDDPKYLQWCLDNGKSETIKGYVELLTNLKRTEIPSEEEQNKRLTLINKVKEMYAFKDMEQLMEDYHVKDIATLTTEELEAIVKNN